MASLSILIPTKNRYEYLFPVVKTIISKITRDDLEIIIQDNSDDNTKGVRFFEDLADFRVKYFYHSGSLPVSDNVELAISNATKDYLTIIGDMPRFYHGIVKGKLLEKIKEKAGRYIISSCPDICLATEIAITVDTFYHLNYPVTVYGASIDSAAGLGARNAHFAELSKLPFLRSEIMERWNNYIPYIWSPVTTYAQSVSEVLTVMLPNRQVDFSAMYVSMLKNERNLMPYIKPAMKRYFARNPLAIFKAMYHIIRKLCSIRYNVLNEDVCTIQICDTVDECMKLMPKLSIK